MALLPLPASWEGFSPACLSLYVIKVLTPAGVGGVGLPPLPQLYLVLYHKQGDLA